MSLADFPELTGFFSYSREDDTGSSGRLTKLRQRIHEELRSQLGRRKANFRVWQDTVAISEGALWESEIRTAIAQSVFFIPIITPTAIKSDYCKAEFELFLAREKELGRNDLIFPILYIRVPELENELQWRRSPALKIVGERQYLNWLQLRHLDMDSKEIGIAIEQFCRSIHDALCLPGPSPEELGRQEQETQRLSDGHGPTERPTEENSTAAGSTDQPFQDTEDQDRKSIEQLPTVNGKDNSQPESDPAEVSLTIDLQRKLEVDRFAAKFFAMAVFAISTACFFLYRYAIGLSLFSLFGFSMWVLLIVSLLLDVFCFIGMFACFSSYREFKEKLRELQKMNR